LTAAPKLGRASGTSMACSQASAFFCIGGEQRWSRQALTLVVIPHPLQQTESERSVFRALCVLCALCLPLLYNSSQHGTIIEIAYHHLTNPRFRPFSMINICESYHTSVWEPPTPLVHSQGMQSSVQHRAVPRQGSNMTKSCLWASHASHA
jgi:hypothetical protein